MANREIVEFIESYIKVHGGDYQWNGNNGELIRCKNCKYGKKKSMGSLVVLCELIVAGRYREHNGEWFCADGKRK